MKYKILLGLGSLATIVTPISTIIACGKDVKTKVTPTKTDQQIVDEAKTVFVNASSSKDKAALATSIGSKAVAATVTIVELGYIAPDLADGVSATYAIKTPYNATSQKVVITVTITKEGARATQELEITAMTDVAVANAAIQALTSANLNVMANDQQLPSAFVALEVNKTNILAAIQGTITNNEEAKGLILLGNITLASDDQAGTITVTIVDHGDSKEFTISGFISQADLDASQLTLTIEQYLINILKVSNTREANDAQRQFPSGAFDVTIGQTTFSVTATKGDVNNDYGSIAYTYRATNSNLATSPAEGRGTIFGFQTNLTPSQKKASVQGELNQTIAPINSHSPNIAPEDYSVETAKSLLNALVVNKYDITPTYTKETMGDGQVTFAIIYTFGQGHTATKNVVVNRLKSNAAIQRDNDNSDINEVAQIFVDSSINVTLKSSIAAVLEGTSLDQAKAQSLGIAWPDDLKDAIITYSHDAIMSDGILQVSIKIAKGSGQEVIKQLAITVTGIDAFKLTAEKRKVILKSLPYKTGLDLDSKIYNNSSAKFLVKENEALVPLGSNYIRFMYIESENLLVRFSLVNPHMRGAYSGDVIRKYQNNNAKIIGYLKAKFDQGYSINLNPKLTNIEKTAIKRQFAKINDHNITSLESTMKFGFAYITYVGTKYKERESSYKAWESIDTNDYIFSNLIGTTIASDRTEMAGSKSKYQTKLDELEKLVDLLNYTGVEYWEYGISMGRQIKQVVVDVTSTSIFTNTMAWYINYFL